MKMKFYNVEDYGNWYVGAANIEKTPTVIEDKDRQLLIMDMFTEHKDWRKALDQFADTFLEDFNNLPAWPNMMQTFAEKEIFWQVYENEEGIFSWGLEKTENDTWYIYLRVKGIYK